MTSITLGHYLSLGAILFTMSIIGIFMNRKNLIVLLMAIELMLLAVNLNFVAFSHYLGDMAGQVFVFFILTVAAAESAIGLAILVLVFRNRLAINVSDLDTLKAQAASPNPKWPVIGAVVGSLRTLLESAGGGILTAQAQSWMATLRGG